VSVCFDPASVLGKTCLIVGGGAIAARALGPLLETGARLTVVSPTLAPALLEVARDGRLRWWPREYTRGDVAGFTLVIVATDDDAVNAQAAAEARERSVEVIGERLAVRAVGPDRTGLRG
jgi:siroheme synthase-like protein